MEPCGLATEGFGTDFTILGPGLVCFGEFGKWDLKRTVCFQKDFVLSWLAT